MTDRCEPPEALRGVDGWHYIGREGEEPSPAFWEAADGWWTTTRHDYKADKMGALGYRYLSPALTPAEADALRAEVERLRTALATIAEQRSGLDLNATRREQTEYWCRLALWYRDTARAAIRALKEPT